MNELNIETLRACPMELTGIDPARGSSDEQPGYPCGRGYVTLLGCQRPPQSRRRRPRRVGHFRSRAPHPDRRRDRARGESLRGAGVERCAAVRLARLAGAAVLVDGLGRGRARQALGRASGGAGRRCVGRSTRGAHPHRDHARGRRRERTITTFGARLEPQPTTPTSRGSWQRWTPCTSPPATSAPCGRHAKLGARDSPRALHALGHGVPLDALRSTPRTP